MVIGLIPTLELDRYTIPVPVRGLGMGDDGAIDDVDFEFVNVGSDSRGRVLGAGSPGTPIGTPEP